MILQHMYVKSQVLSKHGDKKGSWSKIAGYNLGVKIHPHRTFGRLCVCDRSADVSMKPAFPQMPPAHLSRLAPPALGGEQPAALEASVVSEHGPIGCT